MPSYASIEDFLQQAQSLPVIDVRAPAEFHKGHFPGAINLPLFNDEERREIGTLYKKSGRTESLLRGLQLVGPKMKQLAEFGLDTSQGNPVLLPCWRGGMRSRSLAWLLEQVDIKTIVLQGGYKSFRRWTLESFKKPVPLVVLSGLTGSGKTSQLEQLAANGEQIVDLEKLANHRGSAFGGIGQGDQPTNEQFENNLAIVLANMETGQRVWVEDESRMVGSIRLPHHFFDQLRTAPAIFMDVDVTTRVRLIKRDYGHLNSGELSAAIGRIAKRLGGQNMRTAIELLESGCVESCIRILLEYYDKLYLANKDKLPREIFLNHETNQPESTITSKQLVQLANKNLPPFDSAALNDQTAHQTLALESQ